jgi:hypothetical protein
LVGMGAYLGATLRPIDADRDDLRLTGDYG